MNRWVVRGLMVLIVAAFLIRNLPWHLDDFDQAKQAFVSFEMVEDGHWWFQHTPSGRIATKPPLAGWISAAVYGVTRSWEAAWRLPPFVAALALMWLLWRAAEKLCHPERSEAERNEVEGSRGVSEQRQFPETPQDLPRLSPAAVAQTRLSTAPGSARDDSIFLAPIIAVSAFGLNLFTPRLATLVRTDMLLTLFIFTAGFLIYEKLRTQTAWSARDRWTLFAVILASMLTKGPIAYAFLLPGLLVFLWLTRARHETNGAWSGWWPWILPLLFFGAWIGIGVWQSNDFYQQVVEKEFLGRFTTGEEAVHKNQPLYFYVTHLLHKFAPWSWLLAALPFQKAVREKVKQRPELLWLTCWALGGLVVMSLVPSKRPDRIFPVIPPFCLLLPAMLSCVGERRARLAAGAVALAVVASVGYSIFNVVRGYRTDQGTLVRFGEEVRAAARQHGWRYGITGTKDEGMMLYLRRTQFVEDAEKKWKRGEIDALVLPERELKRNGKDFEPYTLENESRKAPEKSSRYFFIGR